MVAVTKSASPEEVLALVALGVSEIAENRTVLFRERWSLFSDEERPVMHLIGSLQTNKVKEVVGNAALIQSVDRRSLAEEIQKRAAKAGICQGVLLEINSGREEAKGGALPEEAEALAEELSLLPNLALRGVMTMGPVGVETEVLRRAFRETREIFKRLSQRGLLGDDPILSMGMSESFPLAIEEGATMVRIGRTLFAREQ
jgi:pyridoxal phosphate enzyme (YggS family)